MLPVPDRQVDPGLLLDANVGAMLAWRSDSIMLRLLWPVFEDLLADAERAVCVEPTDPCSLRWPDQRHRWCESCGLLDIASRVLAVARAGTVPTEHAPLAAGEPSVVE